MSALKTCPYCGGHGYINQFEDIEGGCRAWSKTCIACNGTGTILCQETNADRIRRMSDEELARFLCDFRSCDSDGHPCGGCKAEPYCKTGHNGMIDWLQQLAEEDT